ncbi:MAG TPA: hypothetical protein PLJ21_08945 [Pseudobdellovibrionaceae bacterium]|nr:hypothetical protein [Pseudobdellovibrionaceae bacterium]
MRLFKNRPPVFISFVFFFTLFFLNIQNVHAAPLLLAQNESDEFYDPFADYSEFDTENEEEADIYFFKHGRFFSVGMAGGQRSFTGNMSTQYAPNIAYGFFINYFFDFRFAFSLSYLTGVHKVKISTTTPNTYEGSLTLSSINLDFKYYFNPQNFTKKLAALNPYIIGGFAQNTRTYSLATISDQFRDSAMGFNMGMGIEIPMMKKKSFIGLQGNYYLVNFPDESKKVFLETETLSKTIDGDYFQVLAVLGTNF